MVESAAKPFISTDDLQALMQGGEPLRILDCSIVMDGSSDPHLSFSMEHIDGARFFDHHFAKDQSASYPFMMPGREHFVKMAKALDVRKSYTVVCYDCQKGWFANRAAFMFRAYGHTNVRVLDGGFPKWKADGKAVVADAQVAAADDFDYQFDAECVKSYEQVKAITEDKSAQIIDNRGAGGFAQGSIPTSISVPQPTLVNEDGTFKNSDELKATFEAAGVDLAQPMVFTCGGGIMATVGKIAADQAGATGHRSVFDGSWAEWSANQ